jgi:hypothetical protein
MKRLFIILMMQITITCIKSIDCYAQNDYDSRPFIDRNQSYENNQPEADPKDDNTKGSAKQPAFALLATVYTGLPYLKDDNPAGFTQTYLQAQFNRHYNRRDDITEYSFFRNFFLRGYFSTNVTALNTYDTTTNKPVSYVNKVDLYQHANAMINMYENVFTIHPRMDDNSLWNTVLFFDLFESYMRTNVTDSISKGTFNVDSWLLGGNFSASVASKNNLLKLPVAFLISNELFWVNPITNSVSPDLNFQYANRGDVGKAININKNLLTDPRPYYHLDAQIEFTLSKQQDDSAKNDPDNTSSAKKTKGTSPANKLFLHLGYVSNLFPNTNKDYYNSYFLAQIGLSIDIINTIKNYTGK